MWEFRPPTEKVVPPPLSTHVSDSQALVSRSHSQGQRRPTKNAEYQWSPSQQQSWLQEITKKAVDTSISKAHSIKWTRVPTKHWINSKHLVAPPLSTRYKTWVGLQHTVQMEWTLSRTHRRMPEHCMCHIFWYLIYWWTLHVSHSRFLSVCCMHCIFWLLLRPG